MEYRFEICSRIRLVISEFANGKVMNLSRLIGENESRIRSYVNDNKMPSAEFIAKITTKLEINCDWMLNGIGEMRKDTSENSTPVTNVTLIDNDFYINIINDQSKLIKLLEEKIEKLEIGREVRTDYDVAAEPAPE